jgi:ElaB/YqjD/DUF883 family membrane-anchored ribosome-binding protein
MSVTVTNPDLFSGTTQTAAMKEELAKMIQSTIEQQKETIMAEVKTANDVLKDTAVSQSSDAATKAVEDKVKGLNDTVATMLQMVGQHAVEISGVKSRVEQVLLEAQKKG